MIAFLQTPSTTMMPGLRCWTAFGAWACSQSLPQIVPPVLPADAEYDHDAGLEMLDNRKVGKAKEGQQQREKQRQVREYNKMSSALVSAVWCGMGVDAR